MGRPAMKMSSACGMHSAGSDVISATLVRSSVCGTGAGVMEEVVTEAATAVLKVEAREGGGGGGDGGGGEGG